MGKSANRAKFGASIRTKRINRRESFTLSPKASEFRIDKPIKRRRLAKKRAVIITASLVFIFSGVYLLRNINLESIIQPVLVKWQSKETTKVAEPSFEEKLLLELKNVLTVVDISKIDKNTVQIVSTDNLLILFSPNKDTKPQVDSLQTILTRSRIEKRLLKKIDLRFSKIALEYY